MKVELIQTDDGSTSLYVPSIDESFHSKYGALTESVHVYIEKALYERLSIDDLTTVNILEVGFGTGLNALLAIIACLNKGVNLNYVGLEPFPLEEESIASMNYTSMLSHNDASDWYQWLHEAAWEQPCLRDSITVEKHKATIEDFTTETKFDVIFFDAFAPEKQPELWTPIIFKKVFGLMKEFGILTTYCAKGQVKRDLLGSGFMVENIQGPPGKREMIRAGKPPQNS